MSGMIGTIKPKFGIFGETMNTASRMETTCQQGRIHVSSKTYSILQDFYDFEPTGGIDVKGLGHIETYHVLWKCHVTV